MSLGLTSEQLFETFLKCLQERTVQLKGALEAIAAGESPEAEQKWLNAIHRSQLFPKEFTLELRTALNSIIISLMDTIEINNNAIAKSILEANS